MLRSYLKLILSIIFIFLTLSIIARALGTTQPPNPALRGFVEGCEDKPQPCWYGIVPGVTTLDEVRVLLKRYDITTYYRELQPGHPDVKELALYDSPALFGCDISFIHWIDASSPSFSRDRLRFANCQNLTFEELYFLVKYPGRIIEMGCQIWLVFDYPTARILVKAGENASKSPVLYASQPVIEFSVNAPQKYWTAEYLHFSSGFVPPKRWHYLQLAYFTTGCG